MRKLANFIVNKRYIVMAVMLAFTIVCAFLMPRVAINTDMTKYLPDDSSMKIGLDKMEQAFPGTEIMKNIRVMFQDLEETQKEEIQAQLEQIPYVDSVDYQPGSEDYNRENKTLYVINTAYDYGSAEERSIEAALDQNFSQYQMVYKNGNTSTTDIPLWILALAVGLLMVILFIMCGSWAEPFLFLVAIGIAVVLNMGTNIFLGSISNITFSIAAILQLALSMDYSIILINRYRQELRQTSDRMEAMKSALTNAFSSIASSSLTTVVGLLALVFMSFKIGFDLGIVLAKGVFISMITILTILPGLILIFDKLIQKTAKKEPKIPMKRVAGFSFRFHRVIAAAFAVLFVGAYFLQTNTKTAYTLVTNDPIAEVFPTTNTIVMLYGNEDDAQVTELAEELERETFVKSALSYATTLGNPYTAQQLAEAIAGMGGGMELDPSLLNILYYDYFAEEEPAPMSVSELIGFLTENVAENELFAGYLDQGIKENIALLEQFADPETLTKPMSIQELSGFFGMDAEQIKQLLLYYYGQKGGVPTGTMTLPVFVDFVLDEVASNQLYASQFDAAALAQMKTLSVFTDAKTMTAPAGYQTLARLFGMDEEIAKLLFVYRYALSDGYEPAAMTLPAFVQLVQGAAQNPVFSGYFDQAVAAQIEMLARFADPETIQKQMDSGELAAALGLEPALASQVFLLYYGDSAAEGKTMTFPQFTGFLVDAILPDETYAGYFDETVKAQLTAMHQIASAASSGQEFTAGQMAQVLGIAPELTQQLYLLYFKAPGENQTLSLPVFTAFLVNDVLQNEAFAGFFDDAAKAQLTAMNQIASAAASGQGFTAAQLAQQMGIDEALTSRLFAIYFGSQVEGKTMSLVQFVDFLLSDVVKDESFSAYFEEAAIEQLYTVQSLMKASLSGQTFTYGQTAQLLGLEEDLTRLLYTYGASASDADSWRMSPQAAVNFLVNNSDALGAVMESGDLAQLRTAQTFINSAVAGTAYSAKGLAGLLGMDAGQMNQLFLLYISEHGDTGAWRMSVQDFVDFLVEDVLPNPVFAGQFEGETASQLQTAKTVIDAVVSGEPYAPAELAGMLGSFADGIDPSTVELLYLYHSSLQSGNPDWTLSLQQLFDYLSEDVLNDPRFAGVLDDTLRTEIENAKRQLEEGAAQLKSDEYSLLTLMTTLPDESEETTAFLDRLTAFCNEKLEGEYYLIGNSAMNYEMEQNFDSEMLLITLLTAIAIFIVVAVTFRSFIIPAILVLIVQCGVYITVSIIGLQGYSIYYLALLIVQCILMGATIDYGILFTNYYREKRAGMEAKEALAAAYHGSIHTILTSASIMVIVTGIIGYCFEDPTVGQICRTISIGALSATVLILFILPGLLVVFDRFIAKKAQRKGNTQEKNK